MKLTTRGRYAVAAMLDLALHGDQAPVALQDIADRQNRSLAYLEQLFACLRRAQLVASLRGPGGGYRLAKTVDQISVADIIDAVGEGLDATACGGRGGCDDGDLCLTHDLWTDLSAQIYEFLGGVTLATLVGRQRVRQVARRQQHRGTDRRIPARVV